LLAAIECLSALARLAWVMGDDPGGLCVLLTRPEREGEAPAELPMPRPVPHNLPTELPMPRSAR
jgi:hypothetical protein